MTVAKQQCLIIAGGKENNLLSFYEKKVDVPYVIACDKGYEYALKQGISVDYVSFLTCKQGQQ